ncbi:ribonuclease H-like domain-containing protein [Tanacetum coccineum]|uniref:Ribonuclease H-like domain-containing protein n=1 Tax=Tanacetum coccineum TaxID=301880 RepID=A0ABQ5E9K8_9ASTR
MALGIVAMLDDIECFNGENKTWILLPRGSDTAYLLLYVDDIILTASSTAFLQSIIATLHAEFSMTDLGPLNYFLGISSDVEILRGCFYSHRIGHGFKRFSAAYGDPVSDLTFITRLAGAPSVCGFSRRLLIYLESVVQQTWGRGLLSRGSSKEAKSVTFLAPRAELAEYRGGVANVVLKLGLYADVLHQVLSPWMCLFDDVSSPACCEFVPLPLKLRGDVSRRVCMAQRPDLYLYLVLMIRLDM